LQRQQAQNTKDSRREETTAQSKANGHEDVSKATENILGKPSSNAFDPTNLSFKVRVFKST